MNGGVIRTLVILAGGLAMALIALAGQLTNG